MHDWDSDDNMHVVTINTSMEIPNKFAKNTTQRRVIEVTDML